jgi:hypothetical protein
MTQPITIGSGISVGSGVSIGTGNYSFTLYAEDFNNAYPYNTWNGHQYPACLGINGTAGFTLDLTYVGTTDPGYLNYPAWNPYNPYNFTNDRIYNFFADLVSKGVISNNEDLLWSVEWGPGSTYPTGYVSMGYYQYGSYSNAGILMSPLDTTVTGWNTNPPNNTATQSLAGTYYLPATFTLVLPVVNKGGQWC